MCGIVGIVGKTNTVPSLLKGLKRLEYRGYDSSGIAVTKGGILERRRASGKISSLEALLKLNPLEGCTGIGHTRWATHGVPSEANAHPHVSESVAVVHNGIIENYAELKSALQEKGHIFTSETDTEVVAHQITDFMNQGFSPQEAVSKTLPILKGAFALVMIFSKFPHVMIGAKNKSPLALGKGQEGIFLGSDALALDTFSDDICYLEDGDWVVVDGECISLFDGNNQKKDAVFAPIKRFGDTAEKDGYRHYMQKEIFQQPAIVERLLDTYMESFHSLLPHSMESGINHITIVACGTSFYAGAIAKYWIEEKVGIPVCVDIASEFRYRRPALPEKGLCIFISQSGETADTLAAMQYAKENSQKTLAIVNVETSSLARLCDASLLLYAGREIGVASTKAFMAQLMVLAFFSLYMAHKRGKNVKNLLEHLQQVPEKIKDSLEQEEALKSVAAKLTLSKSILFLGRSTHYGLALEGALKMKELSYIHAEAYAAGELKHGPIALVDSQMPIFISSPYGPLFEKMASNTQEVLARGGDIYFLTDYKGSCSIPFAEKVQILVGPEADPFIQPMVYTPFMQLLAYHTAVLKGTDVDQPRNLAKSVTVE